MPPTLILVNLTAESLSCRPVPIVRFKSVAALDSIILGPSKTSTITLPTRGSKLVVISATYSEKRGSNDAVSGELAAQQGLLIRTSLSPGTSWRMVQVPAWCPWRIYITKVANDRRSLTVFTRRNTKSFLSEMPDRMPLSSLCLPGTHDTMAFYGWPISQCQRSSTPLGVQLQSGIRVIDVRLAIIDSRLIAYHGIYPQRTPFQDILSTVHAFLTDPQTSREAIVMFIKQEDFAKKSYLEFSRLVREEIFRGAGGRDMWFLQNRIPSLGEVRGKVVMFSRFGGNGEGWDNGLQGLGIHPLVWPDSKKSGFSWQCKDTLIRTHDWYNIPSFLSIPEKVALATQILLPPPNDPPLPTLSISFLSAASFPLALPPTVATGFGWPQLGLGVEGVNTRAVSWLLRILNEYTVDSASWDEKGLDDRCCVRGWALLDFFAEPGASFVPLLIECNFRGRQSGDEGWL